MPSDSVSDQSFDTLLEAAQQGDNAARFAVGKHYLAEQEFSRARRWLGRAARAGHADASVELGKMELVRSPSEAAGYFRGAAEQGNADGHYQYATALYRGTGIARDKESAAKHLNAAVRAGHPAALRTRGYLFAAEDDPLATQCFLLAAQAGDLVSMVVASCRLAGQPEHRRAAEFWAHRASQAGSYWQQQFGVEDSIESDQIESPVQPNISPEDVPDVTFADAPQVEGTQLTEHATLRMFDDLLTAEECIYLIETAAPFLGPSYVRDPRTGRAAQDSNRTSDGWSFHPTQEDIAILRIKERLTTQVGLPVEWAEPFSLLRYRNGQEYRSHFDWIAPLSADAKKELDRAGQRQFTVFSYLTDVNKGGETAFPRLDYKVTPKAGRAVAFRNMFDDGEVDPTTLHASLPVIDGEKWLATLWVRERTYRY